MGDLSWAAHLLPLMAAGFAVGMLVGLTGVGGGALMTPLLISSFGVPPQVAVGTDLLYASITKTAGGWRHHVSDHIDWPIVLRLAAGSLPAAALLLAVMAFLPVDTVKLAHWIRMGLVVALPISGLGNRAPKKVDGRTVDAKRIKALTSAISEPELQAAALRRLAATLVVESENLSAKQIKGEGIDADQLVRIGNAPTRTLESLNALLPNKKYWISEQERRERDERTAYLDALSEQELKELRAQVTGTPAPQPVDVAACVQEYDARITAQRAHTRAHTNKK